MKKIIVLCTLTLLLSCSAGKKFLNYVNSKNGDLTSNDIYECGSFPTKEEFLKHANHPLRTDSVILSKSDDIKNVVISVLTEHDSLFTQSWKHKRDSLYSLSVKDSVVQKDIRYYDSLDALPLEKVTLQVLPNGKVWFHEFNKRVRLDSITEKSIEKEFEKIQFDSISDYKAAKTFFLKVGMEEDRVRTGKIEGLQFVTPKGRSRSSIMYIVRKHLKYLRYAYNAHLTKGNFEGRVVVKFAIDEHGKVIFCAVYKSTIKNENFKKDVVKIVRQWRFAPIYKPGDITEVNYPFVFSQ